MSLDLARLRALLPFAVFAITVGLGWLVLGSPLASDSTRANDRIEILRQREASLQQIVTGRTPSIEGTNPMTTFDARVAVEDPAAAVVERLARLASNTRARALFIETVEGANSTGRNAAPVASTYQPDPRFALFDRQLTYTTIRLSFETGYPGLGQFLWNLRDLPTIVEVRTLNVQPAGAAERMRTDGTVHASMTLFAYSRMPHAPPGVTQ
jgi:hypothetical protein